ncbi:lipoprotein signal peptidase [Rhodovulum sp. NI22]|nr:lipoprotein signal peptidase [Rhodovulum sp. NI22]
MRLLALTAFLIFVADQATKYLVVFGLNLRERLSVDVWPPYLNFRMAWNQGVNFGLLSNSAEIMRWVLVAVALVISGWVIRWAARAARALVAQIAAGCLVGGALGNVVDRVLYGAVADFLNMSCCGFDNPYSFNIADIAIFAGALGLVLFADAKKTP